MKQYVPVADFYAGRSVFLTGVSGFIGKIVLEKLLYSCRDIDKVYILIRGKKNLSVEQRLENLFDLPVFTRLKEQRRGDFDKIVPVVGDLLLPNLGIEEQNPFLNKVSVVVHSAATVRYDEPLDEALRINVEGTRKLIHLCKRMPQLKSFVYVSTAYSNSEKEVIDEVVYPAPAALRDVYASIEKHGVNNEKIIKKILNGKLNTYIFTKALAENLVSENQDGVPAIIVRPSAVGCTINEPFPGWIDSWYPAPGVIHMIGNGYNRVMFGRRTNIMDFIPADYVCNLIIVAAAKNQRSQDGSVYNCCSSSQNPTTLIETIGYIRKYYISNKYYDAYPMIFFSNHKWSLNILTFVLQKLPAMVADVYLKVKGEKPKYMKLQSKVKKSNK